MKKLVLISALVATFGGATFGQGYFNFQGTKSAVWDGFTTPTTSQRDSNVNVAFLWAASGSVPGVTNATGMTYVPNTTTVANSTYSAAAAWTAILTDPNFTLAVNSANSAVAVAQTLSSGAFQYGAGQFGVTGTAVGGTYAVYEIGWSAAYATPALAAASANPYVGWSGVFTYTAQASTSTPVNMAAPAQWGVAGTVPEPTTLALAGLGGLGLLLFRRRK